MKRSAIEPLLVASAPGSLSGLCQQLRRNGWSVVRLNALHTVSVPWPSVPRWLGRGPPADLWIVTSRAVIDTFVRGRPRRLRALRRILRVVAVGPGTARAIRSVGLRPSEDALAGGTAALQHQLGRLNRRRVLYLRSDRAGPGFARWLRSRGARVTDRVVYRTLLARRLPRPACSRARAARGWIVSSPSAVAGLRRALGERLFRTESRRVRAFAMGRQTGKALHAAGVRCVHVSSESSEEGFTSFLEKVLPDVFPSKPSRRA